MKGQYPRIGVFGRTGTGKTTLAKQIVLHQNRVLVWDPMAEYDEVPNRLDDLDELDGFLSEVSGEPFFAGRYVPQTPDRDEFDGICGFVYDYGNMLFAVEEVAEVCGPSWLTPGFSRIVHQGRHRSIGIAWVTQRLNEVSRTLTGLTDAWAGFNLAEPADLIALASRCGRDYAERIAGLPRFKWLGFDTYQRAVFQDLERLKALWGAPQTWNRAVTCPGDSHR